MTFEYPFFNNLCRNLWHIHNLYVNGEESSPNVRFTWSLRCIFVSFSGFSFFLLQKLTEMKTHKINIFDPFASTLYSEKIYSTLPILHPLQPSMYCDENPVEKYFLEPIKSRKKSYGRESKKCLNFLILISLASPSCGGELKRKFIWKVSFFIS